MNALAPIDKALRALAVATTVGAVKSIHDKAEMLRGLAKQADESGAMANKCAEVKVRSERKGGGMLLLLERKGGPGRGKKNRQTAGSFAEAIEAAGLEERAARRWQILASIPEKIFESLLVSLRDNGEITSAAFLRLAAGRRKPGRPGSLTAPPEGRIEDLESLVTDGHAFRCIYADPPWQYGNQATRASTDNHYPTLTVDEICALPVADLAGDDAHLHLWTTNAFLFDAKRVIEAWGFEYKSCFVWCKPQMGIGNYWRVSHEFLLFGVRGSLPFVDRGCMSWLEAPRSSHSRKPESVRALVERASPGPRIELFARRSAPGWTSWGNEVAPTLFVEGVV